MKWLCFHLMLHRSSFLERSTDSYKYLVQANIWWELVRNIFSEINFPLQGRKERSVIFVGNSWNMRQKCFVKVSEAWCFPAFGKTPLSFQHTQPSPTWYVCIFSVLHNVKFPRKRMGWLRLMGWGCMDGQEERSSPVPGHCHTPREHWGTKPRRCTVASALH